MSSHQLDFNLFEFAIVPKRSRWEWCLRDQFGNLMMRGREKTRAEARYRSQCALFLLLQASCPRLTPTAGEGA
jgi:hypothetical protein